MTLSPLKLLEGITPGNWLASIEEKSWAAGGHWYVVLDADENGLGEFYGDDHETNAANVRLAAAAPNLAREVAELRVIVGVMREALTWTASTSHGGGSSTSMAYRRVATAALKQSEQVK